MLIIGKVVDSSGTPMAGARILFLSGPVALPDVASLTNEQGQFVLAAPAAGVYRIRCISDSHGELEQELQINAGSNVHIDFQFVN